MNGSKPPNAKNNSPFVLKNVTESIKNASNNALNAFTSPKPVNKPENKPENKKSNSSFFPTMNTSFTKVNEKPMSAMNDSFKEMVSPVKDSIKEAMGNTTSAMTIPVIIGLGIMVILFIIVIIFRDQVAYALNAAWEYITSKKAAIPELPTAPNMPKIDTAAIQAAVPSTKEVFNVAANKYKYSDAEPLCKAYGAELATYDQVKDAWNKGADWCNYGWIKGQSAVFPTQEVTYNKLQAGPEDQRGACGITGVNGGYFDNPELRFGVNCYGTKPGKSDTDERAQMKPHSMTNGALEYDRKVQKYKTELREIPLSPFNTTQWA